jgi:hypothetical protein
MSTAPTAFWWLADALQNLKAPDEYFSDQSRQTMQAMGFFQPAKEAYTARFKRVYGGG